MKKMTRTIGKTMILIMAVTIMTTSSKANDSERYINILDEPMPFGVKKFKMKVHMSMMSIKIMY